MTTPLPFYTIALLFMATALFVICLAIVYGRRLTAAWKAATNPGRTLFLFAAGLLCAYAGTKPPPLGGAAPSRDAFTSGENAASPLSGYRFMGVTTNDAPDYSRPAGAVRNERWFVHGAYEAWCRIDLAPFAFPMGDEKIGSFSVFTDGKMRPTPRDTERELGVGTTPMLCLQGSSELWFGATGNGGRVVTWKDFHPDADTNRAVSVQVELFPNGNYTVRSNELAFAYERIDPNDWDGDGIPNDLDGDPLTYDGDFFGPDPTQPATTNPGAYYTLSLVATGPNADVVFSGDAPSDYADPRFIARSGVTNRVPLLLGKTYWISSGEPIEIVGASDPETEISDLGDGTFEIVRPVYIYPGNGMHAFSMYVEPAGLGGSFAWTNCCCRIVETDPLSFYIDCNRCRCGGCTAEGCYEYEGYCLECWGGECDCDDDEGNDENASDGADLSVPRYVFLNNDNGRETAEDDLRAISVSTPSPDYCSASGLVTLSCPRGADRVRLWRNSDRTGSLSLTQTFDASSSGGDTFFVEGVKTSEEAGDVTFEMSWTDNCGRSQTITHHMTVAFVTNVLVSSAYEGPSTNPPPFTGQREWTFDPQNSANVDKHLLIPFDKVADTNDFSVRDFDIDLALQILPADLSVDGDASWYALDNTPQSGSFTHVSGTTAKYSNPKVGGVYRFGATVDGSPESQCVVVLPLAGAEVTKVLRADLLRGATVVSNAVSRYAFRDLAAIIVGGTQLSTGFTANYRGRADNADHRTVWTYNGVNTNPGPLQWLKRGDGSVATLFGVPIRVAKLTNLLTGYVAQLFDASQLEHDLGQWFGTVNDASAQRSWDVGRDIALTNGFDTAARALVKELWPMADDKGKTRRLWPNVNTVNNYSPEAPLSLLWSNIDYDHNFYSPRFLNGIESTFRNNYENMPIENQQNEE